MKGVTEETWREFRSLAAKNKLKTGEFFEKLIYSYNKESARFWNDVLSGKKILTDKEAEDILKETKRIRKEKGGFRI